MSESRMAQSLAAGAIAGAIAAVVPGATVTLKSPATGELRGAGREPEFSPANRKGAG